MKETFLHFAYVLTSLHTNHIYQFPQVANCYLHAFNIFTFYFPHEKTGIPAHIIERYISAFVSMIIPYMIKNNI